MKCRAKNCSGRAERKIFYLESLLRQQKRIKSVSEEIWFPDLQMIFSIRVETAYIIER